MCGINGAFYLVAAIKQEFVSQFIGRGDLGAHNQVQSSYFWTLQWEENTADTGGTALGCRWAVEVLVPASMGRAVGIDSTRSLLTMRGAKDFQEIFGNTK